MKYLFLIICLILQGCSSYKEVADSNTNNYTMSAPIVLPKSDTVKEEAITKVTKSTTVYPKALPNILPKEETVILDPVIITIKPIVKKQLKHKIQYQVLEPTINKDEILNQLADTTMVFSIPERVNIDDKVIAQLLLNKSLITSELEKQLDNNKSTLSGTLKLSKIVSAELISKDMEVINLAEEKQPIIEDITTEWKWELKPLHDGISKVHLTVNAIVTIDNEKIEKTIRIFDRDVNVYITKRQQIINLFNVDWKWFLTTLFIPLFLYGRSKFNQRKEKDIN